jgi:hypothetical protein
VSEQVVLRGFSWHWNLDKILIRIGSKTGPGSVRPQILGLLTDLRDEVEAFLRPGAVYTIIPHAETNGHAIFSGAVDVALGVLTIGPQLENESDRAFRDGDMLRGLVLDGFGSDAVAQVYRQTDLAIVAEARRRGLWPSRRFSPGYKGWPLVEQRFLFGKVEAEAIGVRLNEACMMIPRKSNSFRVNYYADRGSSTRRSFVI